ncbi:MAG: tyrosine-type recombinase/integrase [Anaerotruncus sp.]|nr:MAG: tyrosine-type recombinase/integrase [Anaerotruncus sp.]
MTEIRTIRLCDECIRLLSELKANQIPKSKYIFPSSVTGGIKDTSAVTRRLHRIQDRAGVPRIRFHDLRHSFATLSLEQGMDIKTVSHMLGHTDAGFTMNTYMHVTDSMQENVANTMGNLIESAGKDTKKILFPT